MRILDLDDSGDGAIKALLESRNGDRVEAVFLKHDHVGKDSLCISSQVGCALSCAFCTTGTLGFRRNLSADEIVEEVETVLDATGMPVRRFEISFMGMGEPLLNLRAVVAAKELLARRYVDVAFHLSTVGLPRPMRLLSEIAPDIALQLSLHAPWDDLRSFLIPMNLRHPIADILAAAESYAARSSHQVTVNYCLIQGINDQREHAVALAELLRQRPFRVQLVNVNEDRSLGFRRTEPAAVAAFLEILTSAAITAHAARQLGRRKGAGCGQLDADYRTGELASGRRSSASVRNPA